jgi:hypothetical protein
MATISNNYVPKGIGNNVDNLVDSVIISHGNGNVGIGTGGPQQKLTVAGAVAATGARVSAGETGAFLWDDGTSGNVAAFEGNNARPLQVMGEHIDFFTGTSYNETVVSISSGRNVGIGTNAPSTQLELYKSVTGNIGPTLTLNNPAGNENAGSTIDFKGYGPAEQPIMARIRSMDDGNYSAHLGFFTKAQTSAGALSEKVRLKSNGYVGIGTDNPQSALEIKTAMPSGSTIGVNIEQNFTGIGYFSKMTAMRIKPTFNNVSGENTLQGLMVETGNVGIGTSDAKAYQLHVMAQNYSAIGGTNPYGAIYGETYLNDTRAIYAYADAANCKAISAYATQASSWAGYFTGGKGVYVSENVGIGTTAPDTKLHVNGAITLGGAGGPQIKTGAGAPSGADGAPIGSLYLNTNGGANTTLYVKTASNQWTAK